MDVAPAMRGLRGAEPAPYPTTADPVAGAPDPALPIMFVHVPRTAGTTLKLALQSIFGIDRSLLDVHHYDRTGLDPGRFALVEGHVLATFFGNTFGPGWPANGFVLLRDPVARAVSQARHIRAIARHPEHAALVPTVHDPADLIGRVPTLSNLQTKLLAGKSPKSERVDASHLEQAKALLDGMALGVAESFVESVTLLAERFALDLPRFRSANASAPRGDDDLRSRAFRDAAREHNQLDLALHRHATALLEARLQRYIDRLLDLPLEPGELAWSLRSPAGPVDTSFARPDGERGSTLRGWLTVDGNAPDAVLVRTSDGVTPLCCRIQSHAAVRATGSIRVRHAGVRGRVPITPATTAIELIAIDRANGRRAEHRFPVGAATDRS